MSLANLTIKETNNGSIEVSLTPDNIPGLVCSGAGTTEMPLLTPKVIYSLDGLIALGITVGNNPRLYREVTEFYDETGAGAELWIMTIVNTVTQTQICDKTNNYAKKLINTADGRIRFYGVAFQPSGGYTPTITAGLDGDVYTAIVKAQALCEDFADTYKNPVHALLDGIEFGGDETALTNIRALTDDRVSVALVGSQNDKRNSIGTILGRLASIPVQRKISRTLDGALKVATAFAGTTAIANYSGVSLIDEKGFITARKFPSRAGFYLTGDPVAAAADAKVACITDRRIFDKIRRITEAVYFFKLDDEVEMQDGKIAPGILKSWEAEIEINVKFLMNGELNDFEAFIDPNQNVVLTSKVKVKLIPDKKAYARFIEVELAFKKTLTA